MTEVVAAVGVFFGISIFLAHAFDVYVSPGGEYSPIVGIENSLAGIPA
jgi:hypothetical protein